MNLLKSLILLNSHKEVPCYYNPKNLIVQHLPVKEKEKKIESNRKRNGYIICTLTSLDEQQIFKIGGKVI